MCNVQRWEFQQTRQLAGMTVEYIANDARATKFDLNPWEVDLDQRLGCCLTYSRDRRTAHRAWMAGHWQRPAGGAAGRPAAAHCRILEDEKGLVIRLFLVVTVMIIMVSLDVRRHPFREMCAEPLFAYFSKYI